MQIEQKPDLKLAGLLGIAIALSFASAILIVSLASCGAARENKPTPAAATTKGKSVFVLRDGSVVIDPAKNP